MANTWKLNRPTPATRRQAREQSMRRKTMLIIMLGLMVSCAIAAVVSTPDLDNLTEASTLIVVGELTAIQRDVRSTTVDLNGSSELVRIQRGTFRIDQMLKGDQQSPFTAEFAVGRARGGWSIPPEHAYGLFFLKDVGGTLQFTDPDQSWIPVTRGIGVEGTTPLERVVSTLAQVLSIPDSTHDQKALALWNLQFSKSDASARALRAVVTNADPSIGLNAARALMLRGDASGMGVIKTVFLPGPQALPDRLEETVSNAISIGIHDPQLIPDLEHLLNSSSRYMRKGVTIALMRTESPNALNALRRALADSDVEVRYYGLLGLGRITDGDGEMLPSMERFKADEAKYVSYWRDRPARRK